MAGIRHCVRLRGPTTVAAVHRETPSNLSVNSSTMTTMTTGSAGYYNNYDDDDDDDFYLASGYSSQHILSWSPNPKIERVVAGRHRGLHGCAYSDSSVWLLQAC